MRTLRTSRIYRARVEYLPIEYRVCFQKTELLLGEDIPSRQQRKQILSEFLEMLENAANEKFPLEKLFPEGYDQFYRDLIADAPTVSTDRKRKKIYWRRIAMIMTCAVMLAVFMMSLVLSSGFQMMVHGMSYLADNLNDYSYSCDMLPDTCSFMIDLDDLPSNVGKVIYRDEQCYIEISDIRYDDVFQNYGGYQIFFRAHGTYDANGAVLVSGVQHATTESRYHTLHMQASLSGIYQEYSFGGAVAGMSALNCRDGDSFSFYIFPTEFYEKRGVPSSEVKLTLNGLVKNQWMKK